MQVNVSNIDDTVKPNMTITVPSPSPVSIRVKLRQQHIREGIQGDAFVCPLALAIADELPPDSDVEVNGRLVYWWEGEDTMHTGRLPKEAIRAVHKFDRGIKIRPFEFLIQEVTP